MTTFKAFLAEAQQTLVERNHNGRAWEGKLEKINDLIDWMINKEIIDQHDREKWYNIVRQYYRYYNDGDRPEDMEGYSNSDIETYLEQRLEDQIKYILSKYQGKYNRADFNIDNAISKTKQVLYTADFEDQYYSSKSVLYFAEKNLNTADERVKELLANLKKASQAFRVEVAVVLGKYPNLVEGAVIATLKKDSKMNDKLEQAAKQLKHATDEVAAYCKDLLTMYEKADKVL